MLVFPAGNAVVVIETCAKDMTGNRTDNAKATRKIILPVLGFPRNCNKLVMHTSSNRTMVVNRLFSSKQIC